MGVSAMTVNRVLKRLEEAQDGAPVLQMDVPEPEPVAEGPGAGACCRRGPHRSRQLPPRL